jgi:hypothetical protein
MSHKMWGISLLVQRISSIFKKAVGSMEVCFINNVGPQLFITFLHHARQLGIRINLTKFVTVITPLLCNTNL